MKGTKFKQVDAKHAIDEEGNLWGWGGSWVGVGDGVKTDYRDSPVQVKKGTKFKQVSSYAHALAIDEQGDLWAWGSNRYGILGKIVGNIPPAEGFYFPTYPEPVRVMEGMKFTQVSAGDEFSLGIDEAGNLWSWGHNDCGQLGTGNLRGGPTPRLVSEGNKYAFVQAGDGSSFAIDTEGRLWAWGKNSFGNLGDGTEDDRLLPVHIMPEVLFKWVFSRFGITCAIDLDGNLWSWGTQVSGYVRYTGNGRPFARSGNERGKIFPGIGR